MGKKGSRPRRHSAEFRADAVKLFQTGTKPLRLVAADLGLDPGLLYRWVDRAEEERRRLKGLNPSEKDELHRLRRENDQLKMEREILKKAAAFFARHQD